MNKKCGITIWICDDDEADRQRLAELCGAYEKACRLSFVIRRYADGAALLMADDRDHMDILLLDIEMESGTSGIEVKDTLCAERNGALIIYTTSHVELAPETHGRNVCGFLIKPVDETKFMKKMDEVIALIAEDSLTSYLEADGAYIKTHYADGRMTVITISLVALFFYVTLLLLWDNMASGGSSVMLALFIFISLASAMSITFICIDSYRRDKLAEGQAALEHITSLKLLLAAMEDNNEKTRCYRHDMKNHLAVIRDLAREGCDEKIVDYIDEWQNKADHGVRPIFASGNKIMDAVILEAAMAAEKGGVKLRCRGNICEPYFVSDFDLCTIVSNLLLNAIEYAGDKGFPEVFLDLLVQGDVSVIEVRNPIEAGLNVEEAIRTASKKDRENHGNGIRNVRETVEAWGGRLDLEREGENFAARVTLFRPAVGKEI